jgi:serine/threonine protein kinase
VLERLRGRTLAHRLREGALPTRQAVEIAVGVARALAHAHAVGVLHPDLKPGNVFLCDDGNVKVLDFGLAHLFGSGRPAAGGTPAYMAPWPRPLACPMRPWTCDCRTRGSGSSSR